MNLLSLLPAEEKDANENKWVAPERALRKERNPPFLPCCDSQCSGSEISELQTAVPGTLGLSMSELAEVIASVSSQVWTEILRGSGVPRDKRTQGFAVGKQTRFSNFTTLFPSHFLPLNLGPHAPRGA